MIRKVLRVFRVTVIVGLTVGVVSSVTAAVVSYRVGARLITCPTRNVSIEFEVCSGWLCIGVWTSSDALDLVLIGAHGGFSGLSEPGEMRGYSRPRYNKPFKYDAGGNGDPRTSSTRQCISLYGLALLLSLYPTITFIRGPLRRHRRRKRGLCLACGYNLTGNVSGACSECGVAIDPKKAEATG